MKKTKKDLFNYLDGVCIVNKSEIESLVLDFFMEEMGILQLSYQHCLYAGEYAEEYIKLKGIKFDENDDVIK